MELNDFVSGFLASSNQIANLPLEWPGRSCRVGRVGGLLFRTHSEQRARDGHLQNFLNQKWQRYPEIESIYYSLNFIYHSN